MESLFGLSRSSSSTWFVFVRRRWERQQRLNDAKDADVTISSPSFEDALGGGTARPARQYVKDLSDPAFTGIGSAELNRQQQHQQQQTVPHRLEHLPTDGWHNKAFASSDPSLDKHQTSPLWLLLWFLDSERNRLESFYSFFFFPFFLSFKKFNVRPFFISASISTASSSEMK